MTIRPTTIHRPLSVIIVLALLFGLIAIGALGTTPVAVAEGFVLAAPTPVAVATVSGLSGKALTVTGAGAAELRFSSYPDKLPQALNSQRYELRVRPASSLRRPT